MITVKTTSALYRLKDGSKKEFSKVEERNCWPKEELPEAKIDSYSEDSRVFSEDDDLDLDKSNRQNNDSERLSLLHGEQTSRHEEDQTFAPEEENGMRRVTIGGGFKILKSENNEPSNKVLRQTNVAKEDEKEEEEGKGEEDAENPGFGASILSAVKDAGLGKAKEMIGEQI